MADIPAHADRKAVPDRSEVRASVLRLLREIGEFHPSVLTESARFDEELQMKSIQFVELQVALEDEFDIEIDLLHVIELRRLDRVINYLGALVAATQAGNDAPR